MALTASCMIAVALLALSRAAGPVGPASCAAPVDAPRQELERADSLLATSVETAGAAEGIAPFLTDDAVLLEPGLEIVRGKEAVRAALASARRGDAARSILRRAASVRSGDGVLGYTFGWIEQVAGAEPAAYPRYLAAWRRDGGRWRVEAFSTSPGRARPSPPRCDGVAAGYHGSTSPGDARALAADVAAADARFAARAWAEGTCAAFPAFADEHAVAITATEFHWGIDGVRAVYGACAPRDRASWDPLQAVAAGSGDLAWTLGNATLVREGAAGPAETPVKYLTVWARQRDGNWKWLLDVGSTRPAPPAGVGSRPRPAS